MKTLNVIEHVVVFISEQELEEKETEIKMKILQEILEEKINGEI